MSKRNGYMGFPLSANVPKSMTIFCSEAAGPSRTDRELMWAVSRTLPPGWGRSELAWLVADSAEFQLGLVWIDGDDQSSLTDFSAASHVRSSVKMAF